MNRLLIKGLIVLDIKLKFKIFFTKTLEESWSSDEYLNRELSNPISYSGYIVVGDYEGYIHIIDPLNGKQLVEKNFKKTN